jgi:hypothetical protein
MTHEERIKLLTNCAAIAVPEVEKSNGYPAGLLRSMAL